MSVKCFQTAQHTSGQPSFCGRLGWCQMGSPVLCPGSDRLPPPLKLPTPPCTLHPWAPWSAVPGRAQAPVLGQERPLSSERLLGQTNCGCLCGAPTLRGAGVQGRGAGRQDLRGRKHIPGALHRWWTGVSPRHSTLQVRGLCRDHDPSPSRDLMLGWAVSRSCRDKSPQSSRRRTGHVYSSQS